MKKYNNDNIRIIFLFISFIIFLFFTVLLNFVFYMKKKEEFSSSSPDYIDYYNKLYNDPKYSHTVDLPLTTIYSCDNKCSSQSKCYITGEQCTSDVDCQGCKIPIPKDKKYNNKNVIGINQSGKYSFLAPEFSTLTDDIGTKAKIYSNKNLNKPSPESSTQFLFEKEVNLGTKINKKNSSYIWNPKQNDKYALNYPRRFTTTGLFLDDGPLASNS